MVVSNLKDEPTQAVLHIICPRRLHNNNAHPAEEASNPTGKHTRRSMLVCERDPVCFVTDHQMLVDLSTY